MGKCPVCGGPVPDDFGLMECGKCGAQLIVHVDGRVEYSGNQESSRAHQEIINTPELPEEQEISVPPSMGTTGEFAEVIHEPAFEPASEYEAGSEFESESGSQSGSQSNVDAAEPEALPPELGGEVAQADMFDGSEPQDTSEPAPMYNSGKPSTPPNSPDLSDLADFANSSAAGGREGPLRYNLQVTGIDTSDVREAFREAITDRKFLWDTEQILRSIRHGEVKILGVAPSKAHMLISRLRNLPLKISWEQHAITQP